RMPEPNVLVEAVVVLAAAVVGVLLAERLRLGAILGYLAAGLVIGPAGLRLVHDSGATHLLAELGVVFLLFMVGLELPLERLRVMPPAIFGLGAAPALLTPAVVARPALSLGRGLAAGPRLGAP